jgi:hypothetical protein
VHLDRAKENEATYRSGSGLGEPARGFDINAPNLRFAAGAVRNRSEVHDDVDTVEDPAPIEFFGDVGDRNPLQLAWLDRARGPGHRTYGVASHEQGRAQRRADESGCAGDKNSHGERPEKRGPVAFQVRPDAGF